MAFVLNFQEKHEIDTTPTGASRTWAQLAVGISGADPSNNDNIDQTPYINGNGFGNSDVLGKQRTVDFSGHRVTGNVAQDYIESIQYEVGDALKSNYRYTDAVGNQTEGPCTIVNIDFGGGEANGKQDIAFGIHLNGKPVRTPKSAAPALTATVAAGSVAGTTKFTATPAGTNTLAYRLAPASLGTIYLNQFIDNIVAYTSGANIAASVGQYLCMFELDSAGRVAKYAQDLLDSGDFPA